MGAIALHGMYESLFGLVAASVSLGIWNVRQKCPAGLGEMAGGNIMKQIFEKNSEVRHGVFELVPAGAVAAEDSDVKK